MCSPNHTRLAILRVAVVTITLLLGCGGSPPSGSDATVSIGALLPYTGQSAAEGINLERALILATERINATGGVANQRLRLVSRDTHSELGAGLAAAKDLVANYPMTALIGPVETDVAIQLAPFIASRRVVQVFPSVTSPTFEDFQLPSDKWWFHMASSPSRLACALAVQIKSDGVTSPVILYNSDGFSVAMAKALATALERHDISFLLSENVSYSSVSQQVLHRKPDAIVLLSYPGSSAPFIYEWSLLGYRGMRRWYLSPTLKSEAFFENVPPGALDGLLGFAQGVGTSSEFSEAFRQRWNEEPMTASYAAFDAVLALALAMESAHRETGDLPTGAELASHLRRVSNPLGVPVRWNEYVQARDLVREGTDINIEGTSGTLNFGLKYGAAQSPLRFWTVAGRRIVDGDYDSSECL